ncbi:hypothetical protein AV530_013142 [Patagioenas fasciata monilis]|uniref:Vesicle-fusing ATPase n=1 Tax=Patagioenas fasciata monilis TaxID=372326 RepID=A0A1V4KXJ9_PATFA|nr:hypothetical protein AV530_013142 [Patagioenas fasciata monilis]
MREHQLLAEDVDIAELAVETKNFSGAELEGLVRAAQSTAMNRHIKQNSLAMVSVPQRPGVLGSRPNERRLASPRPLETGSVDLQPDTS